MTPRPPTPIGHYGTISAKKLESTGTWHARTRFRTTSGRVVEVTARGVTKTAAINRLKARLEERTVAATPDLTADSTVVALVERYAEQEAQWTASTRSLYRQVLERNIAPRIGAVRLRELTTGMLDQLIQDIREKAPYTVQVDGRPVVKRVGGVGAAKQARLLLRLALAQAVRWDLLRENPAREIRAVRADPDRAKEVQALSLEELQGLRAHLRQFYAGHPRARAAAGVIPDLVDFLIATGARIGEALCLRWSDLDLVEESVHLRATQTGQGQAMFRQEHGKTSSSDRVLLLPREAVVMLRRRQVAAGGGDGFVFAREDGAMFQRTVVAPMLQRAVKGSQFEGLTPHMLRRSVATLIKERSGAEAAALQLGHASTSITWKHYIKRQDVSDARAALDAALGRDGSATPR